MNYVTATGRTLEIATHSIGGGGEGKVFPVAGDSALVAKIFHHPTLEHHAKLEFMLANPVPQASDHLWVTWPLDIVFTRSPKPKFAGYLMPKLKHAQPLFTCYSPAIRLKKSPGFDYRHLVRCGRNLAAAFNQAHKKRFMIGDPNESNAFVRSDARITLIDADSWQISDASVGRTFHSSVAKSDFLPPELQNRSLKGFDRKPWHDDFSLAVLLFKLTNEGNHPFDGVYHGAGEVPVLEARIKAGIFPPLDRCGRWTSKSLSLQFDTLHPRLRELFVQAFETGHSHPQSRPTAGVWQEALTLAESELQGCSHNPHHWFWGNECVWCQRKKLLGGQDPFPGAKPRTVRKVSALVPPVCASQTEPNISLNPTCNGICTFPNKKVSHFNAVALVALVALAIIFSLAMFAGALLTLIALFNR